MAIAGCWRVSFLKLRTVNHAFRRYEGANKLGVEGPRSCKGRDKSCLTAFGNLTQPERLFKGVVFAVFLRVNFHSPISHQSALFALHIGR